MDIIYKINTIYRVQDYKGFHVGVYATELTLEEKKEEIINNLLEKGKPDLLLNNFREKGNESFELIELEELHNPEEKELKDKLLKYRKEYAEIKVKQLYDKETLFRPVNRLIFSDTWSTFSRPSLNTSKSNPIIEKLSKELKIDINDSVDIIKNISLFVIDNMSIHEVTRIPYLGSFKIKKSKVINIKGINYGTVRDRRRIRGDKPEQDLD